MTVAHRGLAQRSLGTFELMALAISASCPMAVLAGAVVTTVAVTGVVDVASSFLLLAATLGLFSVGFLALSREIPHAASFYAFIAHGLGSTPGLVGAAVSLLAYNVVQGSLYPLFGAIVSTSLGGPWWIWALAAWAAAGVVGVLHIAVNTRVVAVILVLELAIIGLFDLTGLTAPADGTLDIAALFPTALFSSGSIGGVLAFAVLSFVGFETVAVYREEAVSHRSVVVACYGTLAFLGVFYAVSSWALAAAVGPSNFVDVARDPTANLPFSILGEQYGQLVGNVGQVLLVTGVFAALLAFHHVVVRYIYSLGRERALPARLGAISGSTGYVPVAASVTQTVIAGVVLIALVPTGADPIGTLLPWMAVLSALSVVVLMIGTSIAALRYFLQRSQRPRGRLILAICTSILALAAALVVIVVNMDALTGAADSSPRVILPGIVVAAAASGIIWARHLQRHKPAVYAAVGRGQPRPLAVPEPLGHLTM